MMVLKHEMIISSEENQCHVTICCKFRIELETSRKHQDKRDKKPSCCIPLSYQTLRDSPLSNGDSLPISQHGVQASPDTHSCPCLLSYCPTHSSSAFARLLSLLKNDCGPSCILTFVAGVQNLLHISRWSKPIKAQQTYYFHDVKQSWL